MRYPNLLLKVFITILLLATTINAQNAPYSYSYVPKFVYKNQVFPITIYVKHYNSKDEPRFDFDAMALIQPIDPKPTKLINKDSAYYTFYFKADTQDSKINTPTINIWNLDYTYILHPKYIKIKKLNTKKEKNFSNVIASNLRINQVKIDPYDSKNYLITLKLEANEANLEDISIPNVEDDGIEELKRDGARVTASYYFITPSSKKSINFSYYNTIKNSFITKKISTKNIKNYSDTVELSPKDLSFDKIKRYILYSVIVIFLILIIFTKDLLYIIITAFLIALTIYLNLSYKKICIQEGASVYILPTQNSNISRQIDKRITTTMVNKYKNFNKIEYKNIIGWIKDEDLCKN